MLHREERRVELEREGVEMRKEWKDDMWQSQLSGFPANKNAMLRLNVLMDKLTSKIYLTNIFKTFKSIFLNISNIIIHDKQLHE